MPNVFSTSIVHLVTIPAMTPKAARQGANTTKAAALAAPRVTGRSNLQSLQFAILTVRLGCGDVSYGGMPDY